MFRFIKVKNDFSSLSSFNLKTFTLRILRILLKSFNMCFNKQK